MRIPGLLLISMTWAPACSAHCRVTGPRQCRSGRSGRRPAPPAGGDRRCAYPHRKCQAPATASAARRSPAWKMVSGRAAEPTVALACLDGGVRLIGDVARITTAAHVGLTDDLCEWCDGIIGRRLASLRQEHTNLHWHAAAMPRASASRRSDRSRLARASPCGHGLEHILANVLQRLVHRDPRTRRALVVAAAGQRHEPRTHASGRRILPAIDVEICDLHQLPNRVFAVSDNTGRGAQCYGQHLRTGGRGRRPAATVLHVRCAPCRTGQRGDNRRPAPTAGAANGEEEEGGGIGPIPRAHVRARAPVRSCRRAAQRPALS
jgi:hypothetical protein